MLGYLFTFISKGKYKRQINYLNFWIDTACALIYIVKTWKQRSYEAKDDHLDLLHDSPPLITAVGSRVHRILISSCLITIIWQLILILSSSLALCSELL